MGLSNRLFLVNYKRQEYVIISWAALQENYLDLHRLGLPLGVSA